MPTISAPSKVLVTGASGFIAIHCLIELAQQGYDVVGTVRSSAKGEHLSKLVQKHGKFSYVIVEDMSTLSAFDDVVKDGQFDGILHTAAVVTTSAKTADDVVRPAVEGTRNILEAVHKFGPSVKRVVITASTSSIFEPHDEIYHFTEKDWNNHSIRELEAKGDKTSGPDIYNASKSIAEQNAWKYVKENNSKFDLVTIHPPYVLGPLLQDIKSAEQINISSKFLFDGITNEPDEEPVTNFVDVRDVAISHRLALEKEKASGERFIIANQPINLYEWKQWLIDANVKGVGKLGKKQAGPRWFYDNTKSKQLLEIQYRDPKETLFGALETYQKLAPEHFEKH